MKKGLVQISDSGELGIIVDKIIADNEKAVVDYKAGKEASLTFLWAGHEGFERKGQSGGSQADNRR